MTNVLYSIDRDVVDPVFFPVVPDSFMNRTSQAGAMPAARPANISWNDEQDTPIVAPHDPWSF